MVARQRHVGVAVPQFVKLGHFGVTAAGTAVPEAGQWGAHLHPLHRHRTLDGLTQLQHARFHTDQRTDATNTAIKV